MPAWHLRPRSAPEIVDASVQLLRQHARSLLLLSVVLMIPAALLGLLNSLALGDLVTLERPGALPTVQPGAALRIVPAAVVSVCWTLVAFGALVGAASSAYVDGMAPEPGEALRRVRPRVGVLLGAGLLTYLLVLVQLLAAMIAFFVVVIVGGGVVLAVSGIASPGNAGGTAMAGVFGIVIGFGMIVGGLGGGAWLVGRYVSLPAVAANEALGVRATMTRARELSRGSMTRVTVLLVLVGLLFLVVTMGGLVLLAGLLGSTTAASVLISVVHVPIYALGATLITVLYYDLRIRHEGLDIELLARELAEPTLAAGPSGA